jgi:hypothetical protein
MCGPSLLFGESEGVRTPVSLKMTAGRFSADSCAAGALCWSYQRALLEPLTAQSSAMKV